MTVISFVTSDVTLLVHFIFVCVCVHLQSGNRAHSI